jgi:hypothetical protein
MFSSLTDSKKSNKKDMSGATWRANKKVTCGMFSSLTDSKKSNKKEMGGATWRTNKIGSGGAI